MKFKSTQAKVDVLATKEHVKDLYSLSLRYPLVQLVI